MRDHLLGRDTDDIDLAIPGDPKPYARKLARAVRGAAFELSGAFGAWRVVAPKHAWHVDLVTLRDGDIDADLAQRDFTINAMAEPLQGGELLDPHGGREDLANRLVRMVSAQALEDDPLRSLRAIRIAVELDLELDDGHRPRRRRPTRAASNGSPPSGSSPSSSASSRPTRSCAACDCMDEHGLTDVVLPELSALKGIEQSHFHHLDVHDHTLAVLDEVTKLDDPLLAEPFADELTRGEAMRWAALLHDAAKPQTRGRPAGRAGDVPRPRRRGRRAGQGRPRPPALLGQAARLRRRADPAPPRRGLPRPRAPARPPHGLALPAEDQALQRRHHALHRRRPPRDARRQRRAGDRGPPRRRTRR